MRWLTVLIVCTLVGCASGPDRQAQLREAAREAAKAAKLQLSRDWAECSRLYGKNGSKPATPRVKCQAAAYDKFLAVWDRVAGGAPLDIRRKSNAQMILAAERFDKGEISAAEYELEVANSEVEANTHWRQRKNDAAAVRAAQGQARAAIYSATKPTPWRPPTTTNCNTIGSTISCTTY